MPGVSGRKGDQKGGHHAYNDKRNLITVALPLRAPTANVCQMFVN